MDWIVSAATALVFALFVLVIVWTFVPKGWRTVAANAISGALLSASPLVLPLLEQIQFVPWGEVVDARTAVFITLAVNLINIVLRSVTTTALGEKG